MIALGQIIHSFTKKSISMYNSCDLVLRMELFMHTTIYLIFIFM